MPRPHTRRSGTDEGRAKKLESIGPAQLVAAASLPPAPSLVLPAGAAGRSLVWWGLVGELQQGLSGPRMLSGRRYVQEPNLILSIQLRTNTSQLLRDVMEVGPQLSGPQPPGSHQ